jgi:hypothetical protein
MDCQETTDLMAAVAAVPVAAGRKVALPTIYYLAYPQTPTDLERAAAAAAKVAKEAQVHRAEQVEGALFAFTYTTTALTGL